MEIELESEEVTYKEIRATKHYLVNGKKVRVYIYSKQDNDFSDYDSYENIDENDLKNLTKDEIEEFDNWRENEEN